MAVFQTASASSGQPDKLSVIGPNFGEQGHTVWLVSRHNCKAKPFATVYAKILQDFLASRACLMYLHLAVTDVTQITEGTRVKKIIEFAVRKV